MYQTKSATNILLLEEELLETEEPQVWVQPPKPDFPKWDSKSSRLLKQIQNSHQHGDNGSFNEGYNLLASKFRYVLNWAMDSWDYLITTQGCRFILRSQDDQIFHRGNYRAFIKNDYQKLIHKIFKGKEGSGRAYLRGFGCFPVFCGFWLWFFQDKRDGQGRISLEAH